MRARTLLVSLALAIASATLHSHAVAACAAPASYPSAPSESAQVVRFDVDDVGDGYGFTLFREPCAGDAAQALVYLRVVPTAGSPFVCSLDFTVLQGAPRGISLTVAGEVTPYCDGLLVPTTFLVTPRTAPSFDVLGGFSLAFAGVNAVFPSPALPPYVPGADGIAPVNGLWWNPAEAGSGYAIDVRRGTLVMTVYSYGAEGQPLWYLVVGSLSNNSVAGVTLDRYGNGQCISCGYKPAQVVGNDGKVTVTFTSSTTAMMTLPGRGTFPIELQPF